MQKNTEPAPLTPPVVVADFVDDAQSIPEHALVTVSFRNTSVSLRKHEIRRGVTSTIIRDNEETVVCVMVGPHNDCYAIYRYISNEQTNGIANKITKGFHCVLTGEKPPEGVKIAWTVDEPQWIWCGYGWAQ